MKVQRLLRIIQILGLRRTPVVAEQLALELQVSIRTIYRDIQDLKSVGLPVEGVPGLGYQLGKGYFLPNFHFDADELDSVLIGLQLVRSKIDDPILTAAAQRVLAKVSLGLEGRNQHHAHSMPFKSVSSQLHQQKHQHRQYLKVLRAAIRHNTYLHLTYQDRQAQLSFRTVRPLGLTFFDEAWLLTAWCELRQDFRNFRLDHLQACTQLSHHFFNDVGKTFADYLKTLP